MGRRVNYRYCDILQFADGKIMPTTIMQMAEGLIRGAMSAINATNGRFASEQQATMRNT